MLQRIAQPVAIDLFAGAGGLSLGFELSGFSIALSVEQTTHAVATYRHNHPETVLVQDDIRNVDPKRCLREAGITPSRVDALICGLPCQGFSESNRRSRNLGNPRNHLYKDLLRFVRDIRPGHVVVENVAGMQTMAGGEVIRRIVEGCERLGYAISSFELNAADFGVPQLRRRIFLVGSLDGEMQAPTPTHWDGARDKVTVRDAIEDLPILRPGSSVEMRGYRKLKELSPYQRKMRRGLGGRKFVSGHRVTRSSDIVIERFRHIRPGQNWEAIPVHLMDNYKDRSLCHTGLYHRLVWDKPSKVVGNFRKNMLIHPSQNRGLSVREAARLQSFPDRYDILGPMGAQQQQVADAVPPLLAKAVAQVLARRIA
ncbi:MAG: DNA cytosine methyltransferase [Isosphaeraceae bacterium]